MHRKVDLKSEKVKRGSGPRKSHLLYRDLRGHYPVPIWSPLHDHVITSTWPRDSWSSSGKKSWWFSWAEMGMGSTTLISCIPMRVVVIPGILHNSMRKTRIEYHGWRKKLCGHVPLTYSHFDCATLLKIMNWPPPVSKSKTCTFRTFWGGYWPRSVR